MYKDNGKVNVELLADVGDIAHRVRNLDKKLALNLDDPNQPEPQYNQRSIVPSIAPTSTATLTDDATAADSLTDHLEAEQQPNQCTDASSTSSATVERRNSAAQIAQDISEKVKKDF